MLGHVHLFLKKWANPGLFFVYVRSLQKNAIFKANQCEKINQMSIQFTAPGFEPTTEHDHLCSATFSIDFRSFFVQARSTSVCVSFRFVLYFQKWPNECVEILCVVQCATSAD